MGQFENDKISNLEIENATLKDKIRIANKILDNFQTTWGQTAMFNQLRECLSQEEKGK